MKNTSRLYFSTLIVCALCANVRATNITWIGAENTLYTNVNNWAGGTVPRSQDWGDFAVFKENEPGNKTPALSSSRTIQGIIFEDSAEWTLSPSSLTLTLREIRSSGTGTNTVNVNVTKVYSEAWQIATDNTLVCKSIQITNNKVLPLRGNGAVVVKAAISGWPTDKRVTLYNNMLLCVEASAPFADSTSMIEFAAPGVRLQYKNTVANAKARFGKTILNTYGRDMQLRATNIGNGFVEVTLAAAPSLIIFR